MVLVTEMWEAKPKLPAQFFCDNTSVVTNVENGRVPEMEAWVWVQNNIVYETQGTGVIKIEHVRSKENIADAFTKPLPGNEVLKHRISLGVGRNCEGEIVEGSLADDQ